MLMVFCLSQLGKVCLLSEHMWHRLGYGLHHCGGRSVSLASFGSGRPSLLAASYSEVFSPLVNGSSGSDGACAAGDKQVVGTLSWIMGWMLLANMRLNSSGDTLKEIFKSSFAIMARLECALVHSQKIFLMDDQTLASVVTTGFLNWRAILVKMSVSWGVSAFSLVVVTVVGVLGLRPSARSRRNLPSLSVMQSNTFSMSASFIFSYS